MSTQTPLSPSGRIKLVQKDRARRYGQIVITFLLIAFSIGFIAWYAMNKADDQFLLYMAVGMMALVFGGIGAAYAIMGLGRTVGSNNSANSEQIEAIMAVMLAKNGITLTPPVPEEPPSIYFEDNRDDDLVEDQPDEVAPGKGNPSAIGAMNADPTQLQFLADKVSWYKEIKTFNGKPVVLVAIQDSRRSKKKRTIYIYHVVGTNLIVYNRSRYGIFFMRIAHREENMQNFYETFVQPPLTNKEQEWLKRYDYVLV